MEETVSDHKKWDREIGFLEEKRGRYSWDEMEELLTDSLYDGRISEEEYEVLMRRLMDIDPEL